jgi:DNA-binding transcriptional ArsR family regulator
VSTFAALADPTRARIVEALAEGRELSVNEIVKMFAVSQPTISEHLRVLREAGLVSVEPCGSKRLYRLEPAPLQELDRWLDRYRHFWGRKLDALERHMDATKERT